MRGLGAKDVDDEVQRRRGGDGERWGAASGSGQWPDPDPEIGKQGEDREESCGGSGVRGLGFGVPWGVSR